MTLKEITLTSREKEIVSLIVQGKTQKETAEQLGVSANTVASRLHTIYRVLGISSAVELVNYVNKNSLLT